MENDGRAKRARWSPTGRPYSARAGAIPSWGMPANSTHPRRQHKRGDRCRPPPAPDTGAMPKARVSRIGGPGESGLRDSGGTYVEPWSRRERHPAALCLLCRRGQSRPSRRAESLGGGDGGMEGRPLIRHGIRRDTFPPPGEGFGGGSESRPYGMPSAFARPCGTSQVREWQAGPASCVKAGTKTAGKTSVSPARVSG